MNKLFLVFSVLLLAGCTTPYQRIGIDNNGGYSSTRVRDGVYIVNYDGNESTKPAQAYDYTLLRSAELTLEEGYEIFTIEAERDASSRMGSSAISTSTSGTFSSPSSPWRTAIPKFTFNIKCYAKADGIRGKHYKAADVVKELKAKYNIK